MEFRDWVENKLCVENVAVSEKGEYDEVVAAIAFSAHDDVLAYDADTTDPKRTLAVPA